MTPAVSSECLGPYQDTWIRLTWGDPSGQAGHQAHPTLLVGSLCETTTSDYPPEAGRHRTRLAPWPSGVSLCLPKEAEINSGGKSSVGRYSKVEMAEASSLHRLIAARSRSLRGFQILVLTLLQKESHEYSQGINHPFQAERDLHVSPHTAEEPNRSHSYSSGSSGRALVYTNYTLGSVDKIVAGKGTPSRAQNWALV